MNSIRNLLIAAGMALLSIAIVLGAFSLALSEGKNFLNPTTSPTQTTIAAILTSELPQPPVPQPIEPSSTPTIPATCPPPNGWVVYTIRAGDTLPGLAAQVGTSTERIMQANCLLNTGLMPGTILYLPPSQITPSATLTFYPSATEIPCGPPRGWVIYIIQSGDTLFQLSLAYGVSVPQLQSANCLGSSTLIQAGDPLYVPYVATRTPRPSQTPILTVTVEPPTNTPTTPSSGGSLKVKKIVDWGSTSPDPAVTFQICISGPSYLDSSCKSVGSTGGQLNCSGLAAGDYSIMETDPGPQWEVQIADSTLPVTDGGPTPSTTITNRLVFAGLEVRKIVNWNGVPAQSSKSFEICITGPSYPNANCQSVGFNGGLLSWPDLQSGVYSVVETNPGDEWIMDPGQTEITVTANGIATVTMTNTRLLGGLTLTYSVVWGSTPPITGQTFEVCLTGPSYPDVPSCQTINQTSGSLDWTGLIPGSYLLNLSDPGPNWQPMMIGSPADVPANGGAASASLTLTRR